MRNIHVLPTDKPSRIYMNLGQLFLEQEYSTSKGESLNHNIYITSDEEIKLNDYVIQVNFEKTNTQVIRCEIKFQVNIANDKNGSFIKNKIILTTDQDLIKDGVQAIDDEFLEWFVKNPSCEEVKVEGHIYKGQDETKYKIIIPKEENDYTALLKPVGTKQETLEEVRVIKRTELYKSILSIVKQIPRKEVEEDAMDAPSCTYELEQLFLKWQQEQDKNKYSEEEVIQLLIKFNQEIQEVENVRGWFEKFKNK